MTKYRRADERQWSWSTIWTITQSFAHSHFISWLQTLVTCHLSCSHPLAAVLVSFQHSSNLGCPSSVCCRLSKWPLNKSWKALSMSSLPTSWSVWCHRSIIRNANVNESITILQWSLMCIFCVCSAVTVMAETIKMSDKRKNIYESEVKKLHFWILAPNFQRLLFLHVFLKKHDCNILLFAVSLASNEELILFVSEYEDMIIHLSSYETFIHVPLQTGVPRWQRRCGATPSPTWTTTGGRGSQL